MHLQNYIFYSHWRRGLQSFFLIRRDSPLMPVPVESMWYHSFTALHILSCENPSLPFISKQETWTICFIFPMSTGSDRFCVIVHVSVILESACWNFSTSEVCSSELYFQNGSGTDRTLFFLKSNGFKWVRFHSLICFQLRDGPCKEENAEQLKSVEAAGIERHRERNVRRGEIKSLKRV